ncbi:hypothetical protein LTR62_007149 [Meristemomyces frigidus]|uniref:Aromatic-L-amino-acid decarboxylase n=1 Tax=Meristemomyces frigidus TaxID=1508187 RepID=A0AAN7YDS8_9PEZI|nr:hypothetical protein LTR62_007149 [Meristemomyces frigidus]
MDQRLVPALGMTGDGFVKAAASAIDDIEHYYSTIAERPVLPSISPGYLQNLLPDAAPEHGEDWQAISQDIERTIMPGMTHWQSPKFMAFFSASSTYPGILGEMWSAALTAPAFNWVCSPAVTELETIVMDWLAKILALPEVFLSKGEGGGVIQGSASEAVVTVMVAARERFVRRQLERDHVTDEEEREDRSCGIRSKLVALASAEAHSSTKKGAIIAGTRFRSMPVHHSNDYALTAKELRPAIEALITKGLCPYYLGVTLGTTNTCAIDDFESIATVAKDYPDIWIHCDAAYAGAALVLEEYQHLSAQMHCVDSFDMNMHKWLLTNFDASCLFVQRRKELTDALSISPAYLKNQFSDSGLVTDYRDWQIPLGRRFRALKIWFVLRTWGVDGLRRHIQHHINLGNMFVDLIRSRSDLFCILVEPRFALTVFSVKPRQRKAAQQVNGTGTIQHNDPRPFHDQQVPITPPTENEDVETANEITKQVYTTIDEQKEFFLTASVVGGVYAIRIVSANPLAEEKYVRRVFEVLVRTAEGVLDQRKV